MSGDHGFTGLWDWACLQGSMGEVHHSDAEPFAYGAEWGAGWAFAIVGMAQAIRDTDEARKAASWTNTGEHAAAIARAFDPDDPVGDDDVVVVRGPPTARR